MKSYFSATPAVMIAVLLISCSPAAARTTRIAIAQFTVHGDSAMQYLSSGLPAILRSRITVPGKIAVADRKIMSKDINGTSPGDRAELLRKLNADCLLAGSVTIIGTAISIDAFLVDGTDTMQTFPFYLESATIDDVIPAMNGLASQVVKLLVEGPPLPDHTPAAKRPLKATTETADADLKKAGHAEAEAPVVSETAAPLIEEPLYESRQTLPEKPPPEKSAYVKPGPVFKSTASATYELTGRPLHTLAAGDTNGDGVLELLIAGTTQISVYSVTHTELTKLATVEAVVDEHIMHLDAVDLNGNDIDEMYVSSYDGRHASSFVVEYEAGGYQRIAESLRWLFNVCGSVDNNHRLLGQEADTSAPFKGDVFRFDWKDGELISREEIILPQYTGIYGFSQADIDRDGSNEYTGFTKGLFSSRYQLGVSSYTGRSEWRDRERIGGSAVFFTSSIQYDDMEQRIYKPLRVICEDLNNDEITDVIVARNSKKSSGFLDKFVDFNTGEVMCLNWNGSDLEPIWSSGMRDGYVADYITADIDRDGSRELYILCVKYKGAFGKAENTITVFSQESS